ncbi:hypothetical protein T4A_199 [Trichinella pseudospiralis]|uniref:Uncharacterized protein n=1 Tax=Trichinella pseudospiralis TaxID=6337 RepID=A0A0V1F0I8_TRIPS|nr:hypothetical protein T4A_199 [Trichinella pseudospiralis]
MERRRPRQCSGFLDQRAQGVVRAEIQQIHYPEDHYRGNLVTAVRGEQRQVLAPPGNAEATEGQLSWRVKRTKLLRVSSSPTEARSAPKARGNQEVLLTDRAGSL